MKRSQAREPRRATSPIQRFRRLPRRRDERWQGGVVRLPAWVERGPDGKPYRPWAGVWVSLNSGRINVKLSPAPGVHDWTLALDALLEFGLKRDFAGCRPAELEVADAELGTRLLEAIGDPELSYAVTGDLRAVRRALVAMAEHMAGGPLPPGALEAPGVTVERMRAFAEAAQRFHEAAPWRHLTDEDLIYVEAPSIARGLRYVAVLGAAGHTYGLGFFESADDHAEMMAGSEPEALTVQARWSVFFTPVQELAYGDLDLWEEHGLPVAGSDAYPMAVRLGRDGKVRRPDAGELVYLEGLLRALAETSEEEIDQGRWTRQVETVDGPVTYRLALPALLEPLDAPARASHAGSFDRRAMERAMLEIHRFVARSEFDDLEQVDEAVRRRFTGPMHAIPSTSSTPLERAQDMAYRAFEARGRRRIQLARKALELSAECADAYVILAEHAGDLARRRDLYAQGMAAGERALGPRVFEEEVGHFWGLLATRPYMRARLGLAETLEALGQPDEAIAHYWELLRLNPRDNQGVRDRLLPALLARDRDDEARALLQRFKGESSAMWRYGEVLLTFRREGDSPGARAGLRRARRANRHVARYLTGDEELPKEDPSHYALGSEEEAALCARALGGAWRATPGAVEWLRAATRPGRSPKG